MTAIAPVSLTQSDYLQELLAQHAVQLHPRTCQDIVRKLRAMARVQADATEFNRDDVFESMPDVSPEEADRVIAHWRANLDPRHAIDWGLLELQAEEIVGPSRWAQAKLFQMDSTHVLDVAIDLRDGLVYNLAAESGDNVRIKDTNPNFLVKWADGHSEILPTLRAFSNRYERHRIAQELRTKGLLLTERPAPVPKTPAATAG